MRRVLLVALLVVAAAAAGVTTPARAGDAAGPEIYARLGSWLDIFAGDAWSHPRALVARARAEGVQTLYLETSNYSRRADIAHPRELGRFVDAAHAAGLQVVGWYLPGLADVRVDTRRVHAAVVFRSASGQAFDSFALDIEASIVPNVATRNARLLALAHAIRRMVPAGYPLGAIIPSPVGLLRNPHYWPSFPYRGLARTFDAFLPMAYFTYHTHTPASAYAYGRAVMKQLRARIGERPVVIHMIGGSAPSIPGPTLAGFVRAVSDCAADGISVYAFPQTSAAEWSVLHDASLGGPVTAFCS
jgi:hypothetical protein